MPRLADQGVQILAFDEGDPVPEGCDGVWDPALGMRRIPRVLRETGRPVIVTVPGIRAFSLSFFQLGWTFWERLAALRQRWLIGRDWATFAAKVEAVIAISRFGAEDIERSLGVPRTKITTIHLAPAAAYAPAGKDEMARAEHAGFVHVSVCRPGKNVEGVIEAYRRLPAADRPPPDAEEHERAASPRLGSSPGCERRVRDAPGAAAGRTLPRRPGSRLAEA